MFGSSLSEDWCGFGYYHLDHGFNGNVFDLERSGWTYRKVVEDKPFELGFAPLGVEAGIAKEKRKMDLLWQDLAKRNIPISVVVYPWPAQLIYDNVDSREVTIWRDWCEGKCKRFVTAFPEFFAVKEQCPKSQPGCWYLQNWVFGDIHLNANGNAVVARQGQSESDRCPVVRHPRAAPVSTGRASRPQFRRTSETLTKSALTRPDSSSAALTLSQNGCAFEPHSRTCPFQLSSLY